MGNEWTELKINSIEELLERVSRTLDAVEKDDRYGESMFTYHRIRKRLSMLGAGMADR